MAKNTYVKVNNKQTRKRIKNKNVSKVSRQVNSFIRGEFLNRDAESINALRFAFFIGVLSVLFIMNNYMAQGKLRNQEEIRSEITELRTKYIANKSRLMSITSQSDIARSLQMQGFVESTVPPHVIKEDPKHKTFFSGFINRSVKEK